VHNAPVCYQGGSSKQVDAALHEKNPHQEFVHRAFVAYTQNPNTYTEAMNSPYSKEWENTLCVKVKQLKILGQSSGLTRMTYLKID
jgi:hypothetical protein